MNDTRCMLLVEFEEEREAKCLTENLMDMMHFGVEQKKKKKRKKNRKGISKISYVRLKCKCPTLGFVCACTKTKCRRYEGKEHRNELDLIKGILERESKQPANQQQT